MRNTLRIILSIVIVLGILMVPKYVMADSFNFVATPDKTTLKAGDTVTVTIGISKVNVGEDGINTIEAILEYDETVFEKVQKTDITSANSWAITYNDTEEGQKGALLGIIMSVGEKEDQTIATIKLKVKEDAAGKTGSIKFKEIATNNREELIYDTDKNISVTVSSSETETPKPTEEKPTTQEETKQETKDSTKSSGNLPKTGVNNGFVVVAVIVLIIASIVLLKKIKKYKKI